MLVFVLLVVAGILVMNIPHLVGNRRLPATRMNPFAPLADSGSVPADSLGLDSARVAAALGLVLDPELHISIVDLGLVHALKLDSADNVSVTLGLTTITCPFTRQMGEKVLAALKSVPGVRAIRVRFDPMIPWDPSRATDQARRKYESMFAGQVPDGQ